LLIVGPRTANWRTCLSDTASHNNDKVIDRLDHAQNAVDYREPTIRMSRKQLIINETELYSSISGKLWMIGSMNTELSHPRIHVTINMA
jgi:hypothetical protein